MRLQKLCSHLNVSLSLSLLSLDDFGWYWPKPSCTVQCPCSVVKQDKNFFYPAVSPLLSLELFRGKTHVRRALTQSVSLCLLCFSLRPVCVCVTTYECLLCVCVCVRLRGEEMRIKSAIKRTCPPDDSASPHHHSVEQTYTQWRNPSNFLFEIRKDRWKCWRHFSISIFCTEIVCYRSPWMHIYSISSSSSYIYIYTISSYCVCVRGRAPKKLLKKRVPARARRACVCVENALCACVWRRVTIPVCFSATLFSHSDTMAALFILGFRSLLSSRPRLHFSCLCARACVRKGPEPSHLTAGEENRLMRAPTPTAKPFRMIWKRKENHQSGSFVIRSRNRTSIRQRRWQVVFVHVFVHIFLIDISTK